MAWHGMSMVWHGRDGMVGVVVWHGMVWYGMACHGTGMTWHGMVWYCMGMAW